MTNDRSQNDKVNHSNRHKSGHTHMTYVYLNSTYHLDRCHPFTPYYFMLLFILLSSYHRYMLFPSSVVMYPLSFHKYSSIIIIINIIVIPIIIKHSLWLFETIYPCYIRVTIIILKNCWEHKTMKYVLFLCSYGCR